MGVGFAKQQQTLLITVLNFIRLKSYLIKIHTDLCNNLLTIRTEHTKIAGTVWSHIRTSCVLTDAKAAAIPKRKAVKSIGQSGRDSMRRCHIVFALAACVCLFVLWVSSHFDQSQDMHRETGRARAYLTKR